jgi:hypothetical protein
VMLPVMPDSIERYRSMLRAEAEEADRRAEGDAAQRLRSLADSTDDMTPGEASWVANATDEELHSFAEALRSGCSLAEVR